MFHKTRRADKKGREGEGGDPGVGWGCGRRWEVECGQGKRWMKAEGSRGWEFRLQRHKQG